MVRRTIGFILTVILMLTAGYQLAWHKDLRDRFFDHPWQSFGFLVLVIAAIAVFIHASWKHHPLSATLGALMAVAAVEWGKSILHGIYWTTIGLFIGNLVLVVILWALTCVDNIPGLPAVHIGAPAGP